MTNTQYFTLEGNPEEYKKALNTLAQVHALLDSLTGVHESKADKVSISIAIEGISNMMGYALFEQLHTFRVDLTATSLDNHKGVNND